MDWKSIIRVSLKLFAFLCGLLFALPLGLLLWGMYAAVSGIWRLVAQRRTSDAHEQASTRPGSDAWQHEEGNNTMACLTVQEAPGVPPPEASVTPVHQQLSISPESLVTFIVDLDALRAAANVTFSSQQIGKLYKVYERSLRELAELRGMAEGKKSEAGE
jgi:hypothetical protein